MFVKIKTKDQILTDIIRDAKKLPHNWKAAFGKNNRTLSHDYYLFHPNVGIYLVKEYQKNPFQTKGLGTKLARHIDDDIEDRIHQKSGDFGVIQGNIEKCMKHIRQGIHPQKILEEGMKGNDLGITIPVKGKASSSLKTFHSIKESYVSQQKRLNKAFEKMLSDDGVYNSYE
jgi:hypothetical protein